MPYIETSWVQAGELGLAFVVMILCAFLVVAVMKNSTVRESKYIEVITKFAPLMESISNSMDVFKISMESINHRLENIESAQLAMTQREKLKVRKPRKIAVK